MTFLDRSRELARLRRGLETDEAWLCVLWGRRRVGKSRLLIEWLKDTGGMYFVADQSAAPLQRSYFAATVATRLPRFDDVTYPDWRSVLDRLAAEARALEWAGPLVIDELPYLVTSDPSLPSVLQNWIDNAAKQSGLKVVLSGSSQRMMQGLVLDASAPLFGRATESFQLKPLPPGFIGDGLGLEDAREMISAYAVWGGTPRYWELARPYGPDTEGAIDSLVLDPLGPLHQEPDRLLLEETPSAATLRPLLDVIGSGAHRMSEIAGRLGQPATSLARPLSRLQELGLVRRETPFGVPARSSKKALYVIDDPFIRMWARVVAPHRSMLATATRSARLALWDRYRRTLLAQTWEELCRRSVPGLSTVSPDADWSPAGRHWKGNDPEFDVVAESLDGEQLLIGEVKWSENPATTVDLQSTYRNLISKDMPSGLAADRRKIHYVVFVPERAEPSNADTAYAVVTAHDVVEALRE
ncbi:MAG: ATP-binding protein [Spirochaetota bacterium]